jgi:hypothetical protein
LSIAAQDGVLVELPGIWAVETAEEMKQTDAAAPPRPE